MTIYIAHAYDWICKKRSYTYSYKNPIFNFKLSVAIFNVQASNMVADLEFTHDH